MDKMSALESQQRRRIEQLESELADWKSSYNSLREQHRKRVMTYEADAKWGREKIDELQRENSELKGQLARRYAPAAIIDAVR